MPPACFSVCVNMAVQRSESLRSLPSSVTVCLLLSLCVFSEARVKGFGKFSEGQDPESTTGGVSEELWFTQKLDHFNGADSRQWKQVSPKKGLNTCRFNCEALSKRRPL